MASLSKVLLFSGVVLYGLFVTPSSSDDDHDHDHDHEETCACAAEEGGWTINCDNETAIYAAYNGWFNSALCNTTSDCGSTEGDSDGICQEYYYFVQSHHDYCSDDDIADEILEGFHEMEEAGCEECYIQKQYNENYSQCPSVNCSDSTDATLQVTNLGTYNCSTNCSSTQCVSSYQLIRAYHDSCDNDDAALNDDIEVGIHAYEDICVDYECNTANSTFELVCDEDNSNKININMLKILCLFSSIVIVSLSLF